MAPPMRCASASASPDLPLAVGPVTIGMTTSLHMAVPRLAGTREHGQVHLSARASGGRGVSGMSLVLVLIGNPARPAVGPEQVMHAEQALERAGARVAATRWLADGIACDIGFAGIEGA